MPTLPILNRSLAAILLILPACSSLDEQDEARLTTFKINSKRFYEEGQFRRAEDACRKGLLLETEDLSLLQVLGFSLLRQGGANRIQESIAVFSKCIEIEDDFDYRSRLGMGESQYQMGLMWANQIGAIEANEMLTQEERLDKAASAETFRQLAYETAEESLLEVLDSPRGRDDVIARNTLSRLYGVLGRYDEAAETLRALVATLSSSIHLFEEQLASKSLEENQRTQFQESLKLLQNQEIEGLELLANVAAKLGRYEEVISAYATIEAREGMQPAGYFNRARAYEALGARDAAIQDYDTFVMKAARRGAAFSDEVGVAMRRKAILLQGGDLLKDPGTDGG